MKKVYLLMANLLPLLTVCPSVQADDYAEWQSGKMDEWTSTNWVGETNAPLPDPGYPSTNYSVWIGGGYVTLSSQDVTVATLQLKSESILIVTNGRSLTVTNSVNFQPANQLVGYVEIPNGYANFLNAEADTVSGLSFEVGTNEATGHLDFGAEWGKSSEFTPNFGTLYGCSINLINGGLRVDASNITMQTICTIYNAGQEMIFRGDWLNPDGSTVFTVNGKSTNVIDIAGNFSFGGCRLNETIDANGVELIQAGGNAILTNAILTIGATDALTKPAASYDLIRVPLNKSISTNGMIIKVAGNGGFAYRASLDNHRGQYNYLVITPGPLLPSVTITNPVDESFFTAPTNISLQASVLGRSSRIAKVEFYDGDRKVGEAANVPPPSVTPPKKEKKVKIADATNETYSVTWTNVYGGCYQLKAVATDNNSNQGESPVIGLNVQGDKSDGRKVFITGGAVITYDPGCAQ